MKRLRSRGRLLPAAFILVAGSLATIGASGAQPAAVPAPTAITGTRGVADVRRVVRFTQLSRAPFVPHDPTGAWNLYKIDADATNAAWLDRPSVGFNKDWIVVQANLYTIPPDPQTASTFVRSNVYTFQKADLYSGGAGLFTLFQPTGGSQVPAQIYDLDLASLYLLQNFGHQAGSTGRSACLRSRAPSGPRR
jgi:hypothetical protein